MINTREQVLANYKDLETKGKSGVKVYDQDELICTYQTKKGTGKVLLWKKEKPLGGAVLFQCLGSMNFLSVLLSSRCAIACKNHSKLEPMRESYSS